MQTPDSSKAQVPEGFTPMPSYGGFYELVGPLFEARREGRVVLGFRVEPRHMARGPGLHGGMMFMLLDSAMTHACVQLRPADTGAVTTSFSSELFAGARLGDWVEAEVEVMRAGRRVMFLNCFVRRDGPQGEVLCRGSATFQIVARPGNPAGAPRQPAS